MVACQPDPHEAATSPPLPAPIAAQPASLPIEEVLTQQVASNVAFPLLPPPLAGTTQPQSSPMAPCFTAQPAVGTQPPVRCTMLP